MRTSGRAVYLDSSAVVKLAVQERESMALESYLLQHTHRISSALVQVEAVRAVWRHDPADVRRVRQVIGRMTLVHVSDPILTAAATLEPALLRSLDAIHLATAASVRGDLDAIVTYDIRLASAAQALGLTVVAPGASIPKA